MEIDEVAARLLRQYWALVVVCIALPVAAVTMITVRQPPVFAADARIITSSSVPQSSAEAEALVSQVQGIATSRSAATTALAHAKASRNLNHFVAKNIVVSGLGSSQVVDLTVTDRNPNVAEKVANALASEVTHSLNKVGQSGLVESLRAIDDQVVRLSQKRANMAAQVNADPGNQQLQAKLAGLDEVIANLTGDRGRLLAQASAEGNASVIDTPALPAHPQSKALPQKIGLAVLLGLVGGILFASIAETVRPTVPGAQRVSRRLNVPLLGRLRLTDLRGQVTPGLEDVALRLRLATKHAGVSTVALAAASSDDEGVAELAAALERAFPAGAPAGWSGPGAADVPGAAAANHHGPVAAEAAGAGLNRASTLVGDQHPGTERTMTLRVYALARLDTAADRGRVGLLVLAGPVARVSEVAALADLATSSGWPILGVVGVPRGRLPRPGMDPASRAGTGTAAAAGEGLRPQRGAQGWDQ